MEIPHVVERHVLQRGHRADGQVAVGMVAVDRRWQTRGPRWPTARRAAAGAGWCAGVARARTRRRRIADASQGPTSRANPSARNFVSVVSVRNVASGPTSVSNCAPMRASASCTSSALAIAGALVEHVARERGQPGPSRRVGRRACAHQQHHRRDRQGAVPDAPDGQAVGKLRLVDGRECKRRVGGRRQACASGRPTQCTTAGSESASASDRRPGRDHAHRHASGRLQILRGRGSDCRRRHGR